MSTVILQKDELETLLQEAFLTGFCITSEGYNAEIAPDKKAAWLKIQVYYAKWRRGEPVGNLE